MGTIKSIVVNVSDHDEQLALERKTVREVVERLKTRIFSLASKGVNAFTTTLKQAPQIFR